MLASARTGHRDLDGLGDDRQGPGHRARRDRAGHRPGHPDRQVGRGDGASARVRRSGPGHDVHRHRSDRGARAVRHRVLVHHLEERGAHRAGTRSRRSSPRPRRSTSDDQEDLYPHAAELVVGAVAFAIIFFFMWKWVLPRREHAARGAPRRRSRASSRRPSRRASEADEELSRVPGAARRTRARRRTGSSRRRARRPSSSARTCRHGRGGVAGHRRPRAGGDPRRARPGVPGAPGAGREIAVELAGRVVGRVARRRRRTQRLIDEYIDQVAARERDRTDVADEDADRRIRRRRCSRSREAEGVPRHGRGRAVRVRQGARAAQPSCARR